MVGYIGSKAAVTQVDGYSKSEADARYVEGDDTLYVDQTNNQVGIGTSSPARDLVVSNSSQANIALQTTASGSTLTDGFQIQADGSHAYLWNYENTNILLGTNNTERMRINSSGQVGIGTSSPNSKLTLSTGDKIFVPTGEALNFGHTDGSTNTERMRIDSNGYAMINRLSAIGSSYLSIGGISSSVNGIGIQNGSDAGTIYSFFLWNTGGSLVGSITNNGSSTSFNTSSDYRLKENVTGISDGITRVKQLAPKRFNFIADADTTVDGFLAHEAQAVVPEAVTGTHNEVDADGNAVMQGIDQGKLVPLLTAALQEAITKIETLETKVAALEAG